MGRLRVPLFPSAPPPPSGGSGRCVGDPLALGRRAIFRRTGPGPAPDSPRLGRFPESVRRGNGPEPPARAARMPPTGASRRPPFLLAPSAAREGAASRLRGCPIRGLRATGPARDGAGGPSAPTRCPRADPPGGEAWARANATHRRGAFPHKAGGGRGGSPRPRGRTCPDPEDKMGQKLRT